MSIAKVYCCDGCMKELKTKLSDAPDWIQVRRIDYRDNDPQEEEYHFCGPKCIVEFYQGKR